jgi:hypothetical protein
VKIRKKASYGEHLSIATNRAVKIGIYAAEVSVPLASGLATGASLFDDNAYWAQKWA